MDRRLLEAAQTGDVEILHHLLKENPLIIHTCRLSTSENVLHIAAAIGHADFAKEIARLKPGFAKEINQDGFSPMHVAASNGHTEIVKELLRIDPQLCRLQGREALMPLHCAAIKGNKHVIFEMLSACPGCAADVNIQRETAFHLAVRTNQFEATQAMVNWVREVKKYDVLNMKDEKGNTVLHLAVWRKQRQVLELLLGQNATSNRIEINAVNNSGLTALDLLLIFPSEAGDREIAEVLHASGARKAREITLSAERSEPSSGSHNDESQINPSASEPSHLHPNNLLEYFSFRRGRDTPSEARSSLLVIAILAATATFQAGISPPGGFWQDFTSQNEKNVTGTNTGRGYFPGTSILGDMNAIAYILFMLANSVGFYISFLMIKMLTLKFPLQLELELCMIAMTFSYNIAVIDTSPQGLRTIPVVVTAVLSPIIPLFMWARHPSSVQFMKRITAFVSSFLYH